MIIFNLRLLIVFILFKTNKNIVSIIKVNRKKYPHITVEARKIRQKSMDLIIKMLVTARKYSKII